MIQNERLRRFLRTIVGLSEVEINSLDLETRLREDLKLDGDDFLEAIEGLKDEFGVDLSAFDFRRYCHDEAGMLFPRAEIRALRRLMRGELEDPFQPVTLRKIQQAIENKRWDESGPEAS